MQPIPETVRAVEDFGPFLAHGDLLRQLREMESRLADVIPDCVGLSLVSSEHGVTFTLAASDETAARLAALQCLSSEECGDDAQPIRIAEVGDENVLGEERWRLFAQRTAAVAVASTLTLPIIRGDLLVASICLYGTSPRAFLGKHDPIAVIFGAWAPGAVSNADMTFSTRQIAEQAPRLLREEFRVSLAIGIIVAREHTDVTTAKRRLADLAVRAGVSEAAFAETLIGEADLGFRDGRDSA